MLPDFHKKDRIRQCPNSTNGTTLCGGIVIFLYFFLATVDFYWQDLELLGWQMEQINLSSDVSVFSTSSYEDTCHTVLPIQPQHDFSSINHGWLLSNCPISKQDHIPRILRFKTSTYFFRTYTLAHNVSLTSS